ncbi:hypothetical protein AURDEDRAFT_130877 [Auricularia subglabra TFB-10046 SS5]|nr:hypothetical protein AURDEDRAFT_130877 [Auricularia subglabra TFB-10046 SS5]
MPAAPASPRPHRIYATASQECWARAVLDGRASARNSPTSLSAPARPPRTASAPHARDGDDNRLNRGRRCAGSPPPPTPLPALSPYWPYGCATSGLDAAGGLTWSAARSSQPPLPPSPSLRPRQRPPGSVLEYDAYEALLHYIYKQHDAPAAAPTGVCLRVAQHQFRVYPDTPALDSFAAAVDALNPELAMKLRSASVHAALGRVALDATVMFIDGKNRIQILHDMGELAHAVKGPGAAFIRDERVLVMWSDRKEDIIHEVKVFDLQPLNIVCAVQSSASSAVNLALSGASSAGVAGRHGRDAARGTRARDAVVQGTLAHLAFGVYLVHGPTSTLVPAKMRGLELAPVPKTLVVGTICKSLSFLGAAGLLRIPGDNKIGIAVRRSLAPRPCS